MTLTPEELLWLAFVVVGTMVLSIAFYDGILIRKNERTTVIKDFLIKAIIQAEEELGRGTGDKKLQFVYSMFLKKFPVMARFTSYQAFKHWVEYLLYELKDIINKHKGADDNGESRN